MNKENKASNHFENNSGREKSKGNLYYGWVVAVASATCLLAANNFQYSFGVFLKPLISQFGWSRAAISGCVTIRSLVSGLMSPVSGSLSDRYGTRKLTFAAAGLVGLSYLLAGRIHSLFQLYLILGILTGIGTGFISAPLIATTTKWFGRKAGMANGIVMSGYGMAQIIMPPLATYLILRYGWGTCFLILGVAAMTVGSAAGAVIKEPPQGRRAPSPSTAGGAGSGVQSPGTAEPEVYFSISEAFHTSSFWIMLITYLTVAMSYQMVVIHIVAAAVDVGATLEAAAIILTLGGITNTLGRVVSGGLANRIGTKLVLVLCLAIQVPALFFLAGAQNIVVFYIIATAYGFAYAGTSPVIPAMAAEHFGTKAMGSIFGTLNLSYTVGTAIGPLLGGYVFDVTGRYDMAFLLTAASISLTFMLCLLLKRPVKRGGETE